MRITRALTLAGLFAGFAGLVGAPVAGGAATTVNWAQPGFNSARTNYNPYETTLSTKTVKTLHRVWRQPATAYTGVVVANGLAYLANYPGTDAGIRAFDAKTGTLKWRTTFSDHDSNDASAPAVANGKVYTVTYSDFRFHLSAADATMGKELWTVDIPDPANINNTEEPLVANGLVYVARNAFDGATGALVWRIPYQSDPHGCSSVDVVRQGFLLGQPVMPVVNGVAYLRCGDGSIEARDARTGAVRSIRPSSNEGSVPIVVNGVMYYGSTGRMVARDAATGALKWSTAATAPVGQPTVANGVIIAVVGVLKQPYSIQAFDAATGKSKWIIHIGYPLGDPVVANGVMYVSTSTGVSNAYDLKAVDVASGKVLRTIAGGGAYGNTAIVNGMVFVGSNAAPGSGFVQAFAP